MAYRRNYRRPIARGPKRNLFWARATGLSTMSSGSFAKTANLLSNFETQYGADLFGFTVTRIVGYYTWWVPDSADVSQSYNYSVGIRMDENSEQGTTTNDQRLARLPVNDPYADWMYVRNNLGIVDSVQTHSSTREAAENNVEIDLKAQRRSSELKQSLYLFHGLNSYPDTDVFAWYDLQILLKQP